MINDDPGERDNFLALACVGAAFAEICTFEDLVTGLVSTSKAKLFETLDTAEIERADLFLKTHRAASQSTLGRLVTVIERSGVDGRDIRYLRAITDIRNDFVHRFMDQAPLPGDWERFGYSLEQFSSYTRYVVRHVGFAKRMFSRIMVRHGLLTGDFGPFGAILWNPDEPLEGEAD